MAKNRPAPGMKVGEDHPFNPSAFAFPLKKMLRVLYRFQLEWKKEARNLPIWGYRDTFLPRWVSVSKSLDAGKSEKAPPVTTVGPGKSYFAEGSCIFALVGFLKVADYFYTPEVELLRLSDGGDKRFLKVAVPKASF